MNNFTKDELEELLFFTELHKNKYRLKYPDELLNKLQSLIDNYCEHEPHGDFHVCVDKCKKCGVIVNDNQ